MSTEQTSKRKTPTKGLMGRSFKKCAVCGKGFVAKVHNQIYCSIPCRLSAEGKSAGKDWQKKRTCIICGKEFMPKNSRQVTCGFACSEENGRRLQRKIRLIKAGKDPELYENETAEIAEEEDSSVYGPELEEFNRRCHDCGKPTNDYRCAPCRRKWQRKNKVKVDW